MALGVNRSRWSAALAAGLLSLASVAAVDHADPQIDALAHRLMEQIDATPITCPSAVAKDSQFSIVFCARVPNIPKKDSTDLEAVIDAILMEQGGATANLKGSGWRARDTVRERSYLLGDRPILVQIHTQSSAVVLSYPQKFEKCIEAEHPVAYEEGGEVTPPVEIKNGRLTCPVYPELARQARIQADVLLQAVIEKDGTVGKVCVLRSNHPRLGFEVSAMDCVRQRRFKPATIDGEPIAVRYEVFVEFRLVR